MNYPNLKEQLKVAAIHDISCLGRCSLTVALPILSAMGIETNVIPTAVLSSHTGEFTGYTFRDLTEDILPIAEHWRRLNRHYDAIYTGYFGNIKQLEIVEKVFDILADENTLKFVDPVMADNGRLYSNFNTAYVNEMKKFCRRADIILPNITEACFLTDSQYVKGPHSEKYIHELLEKLKKLGTAYTVLTGAHTKDGYGAAWMDNQSGKWNIVLNSYVEGFFYGAGDTLASVLLGKYLKCGSIEAAAETAVDFTHKAIINTKQNSRDFRYGLLFEELLGELIQ